MCKETIKSFLKAVAACWPSIVLPKINATLNELANVKVRLLFKWGY